MTEVLHSPSHFSSSSRTTSSSSSSLSSTSRDGILLQEPPSPPPSTSVALAATNGDAEEEPAAAAAKHGRTEQLSVLALLVTLFRKSLIACKSDSRRELCAMEIGWPSNVRHLAHVTFDRFNGFLGLPVEFQPEVPTRPPSASTTVFGVSTESMQLSYDSRGNSVPTILLLMQRRLYSRGGLQTEGIFRINAENSQEEYVRDQLNSGVVPQGVDVHCLAGLIKAWFRELPRGVLDSLSPEQVMQCQTEEECAELVKLLPSTEASLLDWAINLMADVVLQEHLNKMNARNIAMMADPLTALMYAVQVMNFLKTLVLRTLRERKDSLVESSSQSHSDEPSDENGHHSPMHSCQEDTTAEENEEEAQENLASKKTVIQCSSEQAVCDEALYCEFPPKENSGKSKSGQSSNSNILQGTKKTRVHQPAIHKTVPVEKKGISNLSCLDSRFERIEAWR
ncbi:rho GTPase-activating protein 5 [Senna tora]|uniref:Rho GTPase-activating protein 5 n=1 Tax=Senna tora TaxID=362788 RepID=A0A834WHT0_9FABA|nr:rho GTPase-activating protein 5 [Senna tora]